MKKTLFLLLFLISRIEGIYAGPIAVDVTYRHLKNLEYEVTMVVYRDCRSSPFGKYNLTILNDSFSVNTSTTRVKIEDILTYCKTKPCTPSNTTVGNEGIEAHYYLDTIDFGTGVFKKFISKNYCNVYFAFNSCCRNGGITTTTSNGNLFVESMLNLCLAENSPVNSPQFLNSIQTTALCNQTYSFSFYSNNYMQGDSISYELVEAQSGYLSYASYNSPYSAEVPLTPLCTPPGKVDCTPSIVNNPVRGTSFNSSNGNFIVTPTNCAEVGIIVGQVNLFRKDSGKYKLFGYSKRDMMLVVNKVQPNRPTLATYRDYAFTSRINTCQDIKVKCDTTSMFKDTVQVIVKEFPKYGTLSLVDSNAREKTLHFCWNVSDSDYIKKKEANISILAFVRPCDMQRFSMSTTINIKAAAPDSTTTILLKTFYDKNKNGKKDAGESFASAPILLDHNQNLSNLKTDVNGLLTIKPWFGNYSININRSQFVFTTSKDTILFSKFDSTHSILLGFNYYQGIRGRVYEDLNNNCVFDPTDIPLYGLRVHSTAKSAAALTDLNGEFLFNNTIGQHILFIDSNLMYASNCNPFQIKSIQTDSQFYNCDFPLKKRSSYKNISVILNPATHNKNGAKFTQTISIENKGTISAKNFKIKLLTSRPLYQLTSTFTKTQSKDTIIWQIDSVAKGVTKIIDFSHVLMPDSFKNGDKLAYQIWAAYNDQVNSDNYFSLIETIGNVPCCKTEKEVYVPNQYYPIHPVVTYRLNFVPLSPTKRALITDILDTTRFDLKTFKVLRSNNNTIVYFKNNVLYADYSSASYINTMELVYSISFKPGIKDSFSVKNSAQCNFDYQTLITSNTTITKVLSPITYDSLFKTNYCAKETILLPFNTNYKPEPTNHFKVYISDSLGQFNSPILIFDTASNSLNNQLSFKLPNAYANNFYRLKVIGTQPNIEAFSTEILPSITINKLPNINFTTSIINGQICEGDPVVLKAHGADAYLFYKSGIPLGNFSKDSNFSEIILKNSYYNITFRSEEGCVNISPVISANFLTKPNVNLSASKTNLCEGELVQLLFGGANTYTLYKNMNTIIASGLTGTTYQFMPSFNTNSYALIGSNMAGCIDTSVSINIKVNPISFALRPIITREGKSLKSSYPSRNQWYNLNGKIDTAINQYFYPPVDAQYYVKYLDSNGCQNTSDLFNVNFTSIENIANSAGFNIYPNPATEALNIMNPSECNFDYKLYDSFGRMVVQGTSSLANQSVRLEQYSSGHYLMRIRSTTQTYNFKVVVIH